MLIEPVEQIELIMVSYFRPNDFKLCINSILENTNGKYHLSVLDNSHGGLDEILTQLTDSHITIYRNIENLGKGKAIMQWYKTIMRNNHHRQFISIDSDIIVDKGWLDKLQLAALRIKNFGVIAPTIINDIDDTFDKQLSKKEFIMHKLDKNGKFIAPAIFQNRYLAGPLLLIDKQLFEKVGGYIQNQLYGNEDGELCKAAFKLKKFVGIATDVKIIHLNNDSTPGYREWKRRNIKGNVDGRGYFDK